VARFGLLLSIIFRLRSHRILSGGSRSGRLGRDRKARIRRDWESVKVDVMQKAVRAKFEQHPDLQKLLKSTGEARLVEHTENDNYWGDGGDGSGKNMLGRILMEVRGSI